MICSLCPRRCGALRTETAGAGACGAGTLPVVARAKKHYGEEPCVSGERGSGTVFFCGCALRCVFCQNSEISGTCARGRALTAPELAEVFRRLEGEGAQNLNLVTASHFAPAVVAALELAAPAVPVVWNTGGYESMEILRLLEGHIDVYLPDYKYADADLADFCCGAPDYPEVALAAIAEMRRQTGPEILDETGRMTRGVLVRHLVLPGLAGASMRALSRLRDALPGDVRVSLMGQYTPCGRAREIPALSRPVSKDAYRRVAAHLRALGFEGYVQPVSACGTDAIPDWDFALETPC